MAGHGIKGITYADDACRSKYGFALEYHGGNLAHPDARDAGEQHLEPDPREDVQRAS